MDAPTSRVTEVKEEWRPSPTYPDTYWVSSLGSMRRDGADKHLKPRVNPKTGYHAYSLCRDSIVKQVYGHREVAMAFLPNPEGCTDVNHKDGNPGHNALTNLEWVTHSENIRHASHVLGRMGKLTVKQVSEIRQRFHVNGETQREIAVAYAVSQSLISMIATDTNWAGAGVSPELRQVDSVSGFVDGAAEEWRILVRYPHVEVSSHGNLRNATSKKPYMQGTDQKGYHTFKVCLPAVGGGTRKTPTHRVGRLVAETFLPAPPTLRHNQVNHRNHVRNDDRACNLEWVTPCGNSRHAHGHTAYNFIAGGPSRG